MHRNNPRKVSWGQHGHQNERQYYQGTGKPGHGHNFRKMCTQTVNSTIKQLGEAKEFLTEQIKTLTKKCALDIKQWTS